MGLHIDILSTPHRHIDPTTPRDGSSIATNPPVFVRLPLKDDETATLTVSKNVDLSDHLFQQVDLSEPVFLSDRALAPGIYFWSWSSDTGEKKVRQFEVPEEAVVLEIPPVNDWLEALPDDHPRLYTNSRLVPKIREARFSDKAQQWEQLKANADRLLAEKHQTAEPAFLPDRDADYQAWFKIWYGIMWGTRGFIRGAATLALAHVASGEESYALAACERMASVAEWDPEGSSYLGRNDEAHMSVIWHGPSACDWTWDFFTDEQRSKVIDQYKRRGQITFDHMRNKGYYGVTRFDSHAGREIVFLANTALVFHEHIPEARDWLEWLRPILCGVWPVWAEDDGAWAEGLSYGTAYVEIMTMFASALKHGTGIDLYRKPFWKNHTEWRYHCLPPYAEWMGFGDHSERWGYTWLNNANLVATIDRETGANQMTSYVASLREEAQSLFTPPERLAPGVSAQLYLTPSTPGSGSSTEEQRNALRLFPQIGWAAIRSDLNDQERDIALIFRSSPYGAVSHSHANNNDFILHVGGKVMAMPSGYYAGYGSDHHAHWVWHTKSHNCVTLSDASQLMRSHESRGIIDNVFEDDQLVYLRGVADSSYQDRANRCRRHVCFLKSHQCFFMVDEYVAKPGVSSALQWNIHSWNQFDVDQAERKFTIRRDDSVLETHVLHHQNGYFAASEGWGPPPSSAKANQEWRQQYHLRYTTSGMEPRQNLGVLMATGHKHRNLPIIAAERTDTAEVAYIGNDDTVMVHHVNSDRNDGDEADAIALLSIGSAHYRVTDTGISRS